MQGARDETAWRQFVHLYTPLLFYWAGACGETEHNAADLVQEVFVALLQTLPTFQYDRTAGKFRSWLRALTLNKLRDRKRREAREEKARRWLARKRNCLTAPSASGRRSTSKN